MALCHPAALQRQIIISLVFSSVDDKKVYSLIPPEQIAGVNLLFHISKDIRIKAVCDDDV